MGNGEDGVVVEIFPDGFLNQSVCFKVNRGCGFILRVHVRKGKKRRKRKKKRKRKLYVSNIKVGKGGVLSKYHSVASVTIPDLSCSPYDIHLNSNNRTKES